MSTWFSKNADSGYHVGSQHYIPDVGYISNARLPERITEHGSIIEPPDLAVEVLSPTDTPRRLPFKVTNYLAQGTIGHASR